MLCAKLNNVRKIVLIAALLLSSFCKAEEKGNKYYISAVAFYNLENLFDTIDNPEKADEEFTPKGPYNYTSEVYHAKLHNLATVISRLGTEITPDGPAFIGVAEVENNNVLRDLAQQPEIKNRNYQSICFYGPDGRGINNGFLYNPKYFKVLHSKTYSVDLSPSGATETTRDVLYINGLLLGDTVHVLVNHWPSRRGGEAATAPKRAIAAGVDKHIADSLFSANPSAKLFIMGDLNDDPTDASVAKILGAKGKKEDVQSGELYNPWVSFYKAGIGTLGYNDSWDLFDQIMLSGSLLQKNKGWSYYKSEVFNRQFLKENYGQYKGYPKRSFAGNNWNNGYSDHFPTIIYLIKSM